MKTFWQRNRAYIILDVIAVVATAATFWYLTRPVELPPPPTPAEVAAARELGLSWLENNFADGLFLYEFNPETAEIPPSSNALRQLMASRVAAVEAHKSEVFAEIHAENLAYILKHWFLYDDQGGYVLYEDKSKLGANAMFLRTLIYSPEYKVLRPQAYAMAGGIVSLLNEDGSFRPWYVEPDYEYETDYLLNFYSGEAILALVEYYEFSQNPDALAAAQKAAEYYLVHYGEKINENYHPAYVPWHTMAYAQLYELTKDERYVEAVFVMNDRLLELLDKKDYPGRFFQTKLAEEGQAGPHSSSDAVYLEGLLYAYELAVERGDVGRTERYREAAELAAGRLISLQYKAKRDDFAADPRTYIGAMPVHENNPRIRVDTTQHALDAFEKYLKIWPESIDKTIN